MTGYKPYVGILLGMFVLLAVISCKRTQGQEEFTPYTYRVPEQVGDGWKTAHINDVGITIYSILEMMNNYFKYSTRDVHGILIVRNRKLVFEEYFPGYDFGPGNTGYKGPYLFFNRDTLHCMHSVTKSFASTLIGLAIDKGFITGVNEKMFSYFPDYDSLRTVEKDKVTLEHLLSMTSGIEWNEGDVPLYDSRNDLTRMLRSTDPIGYILGKPIVTEPGITFYYKGGDTNLLGEIVKRATGLNADEFSGPYLFTKLGITNYYWTYFPYAKDIVYVSGDLYLRPRDMAKFGLLFLDEGVWQGERIISKEWVNQSTKEYIPLGGFHSATAYGYQWWIKDYLIYNNSVHTYSARGWGGQQIIVISQLNAVIVFTGGNYLSYVPVDEIMLNYILPALL